LAGAEVAHETPNKPLDPPTAPSLRRADDICCNTGNATKTKPGTRWRCALLLPDNPGSSHLKRILGATVLTDNAHSTPNLVIAGISCSLNLVLKSSLSAAHNVLGKITTLCPRSSCFQTWSVDVVKGRLNGAPIVIVIMISAIPANQVSDLSR
jgi:hypothetical protein